jgi:hypothetical protein
MQSPSGPGTHSGRFSQPTHTGPVFAVLTEHPLTDRTAAIIARLTSNFFITFSFLIYKDKYNLP